MYASVADVEAGFRHLSPDESDICESLIEEASIIVDAYNADAEDARKKVVVCRMVRRMLSSGSDGVPMGATTGSMSALGYSQSWTLSSGSAGELYISKTDKKLLGVSARIGTHSPVEDMR